MATATLSACVRAPKLVYRYLAAGEVKRPTDQHRFAGVWRNVKFPGMLIPPAYDAALCLYRRPLTVTV
jgi:hypothetical protein